jgi:hypothetical protein
MKIINLVAGVSLAATMAMADNVTLSKDGLGDFLIAPVYLAKGDVCTRVNVFNTNTTHSILAKVAFREQLSSNEVDFPIFLSPGDVWSGTVCQENGDVVLTSTDDSNHPKIKKLLENGKDITAQSIKAGNNNVDFKTGYIEIYPVAEFAEGNTNKVDKDILVDRWNMLIKGETPSNLVKSGVDGYSLSGNVMFETKGNYYATLPMTAFKGTHDKTLTGSAIAYGNDTGPDILLGTNKKYQILKQIQHNEADFTYVNGGKDQYVVFTYPFGYAKEQIRKYKVTVRDMEENKDQQKEEVVIFSPTPKIQPKAQYMKNEVAVLSVENIIAQTQNPSMYKEGQIQITDITNITDVQLGAGKKASFLATYVTIKNGKDGNEVANASYIPTK